jgi:hypothetical protein
LRARGGSVEVDELMDGGDLDLSGSPLLLEKASGEVTIRSDTKVEFRQSKANLHVQGIAAEVRGTDSQGLVEIVTDSASVVLSKMDGPLRVQGNSLELTIDGIGGVAGLITSGSTIEVKGVSAPLAIENEFGDVTVSGASAKVEVKNRQGNVTLVGLSASAIVETSSEVLIVSWASLPMDQETENVLVNEEGEVRVELPASGSFGLEAQSRYGRVESALDWVRVSDDGRSAKGLRGRGRGPRLRIVGEGGVVIAGPGQAASGGGDP